MSIVALENSRILLIIGGGIAAYKSLELIRALRKRGAKVQAIMTDAAKQFVTPLSVAALTEQKIYDDLFSLTDETEMGHIELSRNADLIVVAPATANILAHAAHGLADDLATTALLATDKVTLFAPAMNLRMWLHPATRRNVAALRADGALFVGPDEGEMACGEFGPGRMSEPAAILSAIEAALSAPTTLDLPKGDSSAALRALAGRHVVVTSGPTHEPVDPVRFIGNRSSGRQGHAIAQAALGAGARVTLIKGPVSLPDPPGIDVVGVETAAQMRAAVLKAMPADIFIAAAAVADWRPEKANPQKLKKNSQTTTTLSLVKNPDILAEIGNRRIGRPAIVVGFAAETDDLLKNARKKLLEKGCDLIIANEISTGTGIFGGAENQVTFVEAKKSRPMARMKKQEVAQRIIDRVIDLMEKSK